MTRREQIEEAAREEHPAWASTFVRGAEWADANPVQDWKVLTEAQDKHDDLLIKLRIAMESLKSARNITQDFKLRNFLQESLDKIEDLK